MLIKVRVFDEKQEEVVFYQTEINADAMIKIAEPRVGMVQEKGKAWAQGAVPFFGKQLVDAVKLDDEKEVEKNAIQAAMSAWLFDSIFEGVTAQQFKASDLDFSLHPTGMVVYRRVPKS
ncbi:hypothetical protein [Kushneria aurantia]|uniref:Uncharacterized protein n=1 Tax=Kushneria aurantia TaxID=504092 RepID=A0ABV6G888_9GAMM|nr:hypothetical protein [Kushneria aurantia]